MSLFLNIPDVIALAYDQDIHVFPYGYERTKVPPDWVTAPTGLIREKFIKDYLSNDFLPANATKEQFENLYGQLH